MDIYYKKRNPDFKVFNVIFLFTLFYGAMSLLKANNINALYTPVIIFVILANILFNDIHL